MTSQHPLRFLQIFRGNFPGTRRQSLPRRYEHGLPAADTTLALFAADFCRLCTTRSPASLHRRGRPAGSRASEHGQPSSQRPAASGQTRLLSARVWPQTSLASLASLNLNSRNIKNKTERRRRKRFEAVCI